MTDQAERIAHLEKCLAPFARLGNQLGFQSDRADAEPVLHTLAGKITIGDFRRANEALRQQVGVPPLYSFDK